MAACSVKIELNEPDKVYVDGETVRGTVIVSADQDVKCNGLIVTSEWSTHGRGNVDRGEVEQIELFRGAWQAGNEYRYSFELPTACWPPTYYGHFVNVSHQVRARAKLAWAKDPQARMEIPVAATNSTADLKPQRKETTGPLKWVLVAVFSGILLIFMFVAAMTMWIILPVALIFLGIPFTILWFVKSYLPRRCTGPIKLELASSRVGPGEVLRGSVNFLPRKRFTANQILVAIECAEVCVSGSGSNQSTHRASIVSHDLLLLGETDVLPGQPQSFAFEYVVPENAPPSLDLSDNKIRWNAQLRIDIPRWPDLVQRLDFVVGPCSPQELTSSEQVAASKARRWLDEVIHQLEESADDTERLTLVLEAIADHQFAVNLAVYQHGTEYNVPAPPGVWIEALDEMSETDFVVRFERVEDLPEVDTGWRGTIRITGYLADEEVVVARVDS